MRGTVRVLFKADISSPNTDTVIIFHIKNYKFRFKLCFDQKQNNFTGCGLPHDLLEDRPMIDVTVTFFTSDCIT